jgi:hypothetical protein
MSCSSHKLNTIGEYRQDINGMIIHGRYEIVYVTNTNNGKIMIAAPFISDSDNYLPENIVKLHLGLKIINPRHEKFNAWIDWKVLGKSNDVILQNSYLVHISQGLPEEFISVDLPYETNINSTYEVSVEIVSDGEVRYTSMAKYKIKGTKKQT